MLRIFCTTSCFFTYFFVFSHFVFLCDVIRYTQMVENYWLAAITEAYIGVQVSLLIENRNPNQIFNVFQSFLTEKFGYFNKSHQS